MAIEKRVTKLDKGKKLFVDSRSDHFHHRLLVAEQTYVLSDVFGELVSRFITDYNICIVRFNNVEALNIYVNNNIELLEITVDELKEAYNNYFPANEYDLYYHLYEERASGEKDLGFVVKVDRDVPFMDYRVAFPKNKIPKYIPCNREAKIGPYVHTSCIFDLNYDMSKLFKRERGDFIAGYIHYGRYYIPIAISNSEDLEYCISLEYYNEVSTGAIYIRKDIWEEVPLYYLINILYTKIPALIAGDFFDNEYSCLNFAVQHIGNKALEDALEQIVPYSEGCLYSIDIIPTNIKKCIDERIELYLTSKGKESRDKIENTVDQTSK